MGCAKLIFLCKVVYLFQTVLANPPESSPPAGGQPFLNSLAVLFRSRPPWPTTFPSATNSLYTTPQKQTATAVAVSSAPIPPAMLPGSPKQGILVAHPINTTPMLTNSININSNSNNNLQPIPASSIIKAIRSPNPHTFPNQNNQQIQIQPPGGTISLTPLSPNAAGQGPPHKPGFITIAVKRPANAPLGPGPPLPQHLNFNIPPPHFNNQQQQQPLQLNFQNQQQQPQTQQNFQNHIQQQTLPSQQNFLNQHQPQPLPQNFMNPPEFQKPSQNFQPMQNQHQPQPPQLHQFNDNQIVELDQQQQGQQLQQNLQQLDHQQQEQQFQQQQLEQQKQEQKFHEQKFHEQKFHEQKLQEQKFQEQKFHEQKLQEQKFQEQKFHEQQLEQQLEQQKQEEKFHQQQIDQQKQETKFHPQPLDQQSQELQFQQQQQNNFQPQENFVITTTPPPQTLKPVVDHFRISNRDFNSKYKPTTRSPLKLVTAPLLASDSAGNGGNGFPDPPTPPVFQSFSDNSITRSTYSLEWPKTNSKFDSDYFDTTHAMNNDINGIDHASSQTSTVGTRIKVSDGPNQSENSNNSGKLSIAGIRAPTKLVPVRKSKVLSDFRPSPQLHSFEDTTTGLKSYISVPNDVRERERDGRMSSGFQASEARYYPPYESGFRPIPFNHYAFLHGKTGSTPKSQIENSIRQQYYSPWGSSSTSTASTLPERTDRKLAHGTLSQLLLASDIINKASATQPPLMPFASHFSKKPNLGRQATTSSSELIEDWVNIPQHNRRGAKGSKRKFPIFVGKRKKQILPKKCEKFHRFGFCPVTSHYPLDTVEKIAVRCSALLSHLIAPLPRADVRYDIIVSKNGSMLKGGSEKESGWSWKSFAGRPVCDTKEIKIIPGFAKNEAGQWLVVLQTEVFKQEAQISLCSPQGPNCHGVNCREEDYNLKTKCVQRFTAQRLAVLDPEDQERCPVVRSVFLPSACVCITNPNPSENRREQYIEDEIASNNENSHADDFEAHPLEKREESLEDLVTADSSRYGEAAIAELEPEQDQEQASSSVEREARVSASNYIPVISVENPVPNSTFMIITEKFTTNESSSSTESAESHRVSLSVSTTPNSIEDYPLPS